MDEPCQIGTVSLTDFDRGVVTSLGASLINIEVDRQTRAAYAIDVPGVLETPPEFNGKIPVFFNHPEEVFQPFRIPSFVIRRNDLTPAFDRQPVFGYQRVPACDATKCYVKAGNKVIEGWSKYETRWLPLPFDVGYEVVLYARLQKDGLAMFQHAICKMRPPWFTLCVVDSLESVREYDAGPLSISNVSELADIEDRTIGWSFSFDVRAEIDCGPDYMNIKNPTEEELAAGNTAVVGGLPEVTYTNLTQYPRRR